jgi:WD40 repeat protein
VNGIGLIRSNCKWGGSVLAILFAFSAWFSEVERPFELAFRFALPETDSVQCVAYAPDSRTVIAGTNTGLLWVWEAKPGATPKKHRLTDGDVGTGAVLSVAISPDGCRALAGCADEHIRLLDLTTGKVIHILQGHRAPVFSVCFSRDGQRAFSGSSGDKMIFLWNLKSGKPLLRLQAQEIPSSLAISPDDRRLITTEFLAVQEWDVERGQRLRSLKGHESRLKGVFYSPDGRTVVSGSGDGVVRIWNTATGKCLRTVDAGKVWAHSYALSPDGRRLLIGGLKEMKLLDLETGRELRHWKGLAGITRVVFSPDGRYAVSAEEGGPVSAWLLPRQQ